MPIRLVAQSVSQPIGALLAEEPPLQVWNLFHRACNLMGPRGEIVALVTPQVGNGPLNVVIPLQTTDWLRGDIQPGTEVQTKGSTLQVGQVQIDLRSAARWDPRPDWPRVRTRHAPIEDRLPQVMRLAQEASAPGSWLRPASLPAPLVGAIQEGVQLLRRAWQQDEAALDAAADRLAGLGAGLTPAGDDFLCGVMLRAWLAHPTPSDLCNRLAQAAAPRTTPLSAALLHAAAQGACSAAWHTLLTSLCAAANSRLKQALDTCLGYGATSGADALAGFLWPEYT